MHTPLRAPRLLLAVAVVVLLAACDHYAAARAAAQPSLTPPPSPAPAPVVTDACAAPDVGAPVTVDLVRRADGTCAAFRQAFAYRCDPAMPAVAVVDAGQRPAAVPRRLVRGAGAGRAAARRCRGRHAASATLSSDPVRPVVPLGATPTASYRSVAGPAEREQALRPVDRADDRRLDPRRRADGGRQRPAHVADRDRRVDRARIHGGGRRRRVAPLARRQRGRDRDRSERRSRRRHSPPTPNGSSPPWASTRVLVWLTAHGPEAQVPSINKAIRRRDGPDPERDRARLGPAGAPGRAEQRRHPSRRRAARGARIDPGSLPARHGATPSRAAARPRASARSDRRPEAAARSSIAPMETRKIGSLEVSVLGLGCNNFGRRVDEDGHASGRRRRARRGRDVLRHGGHLWRDEERDVPRRDPDGPARPGRARDEVRDGGVAGQEGRAARLHPTRCARLPHPIADRPHRSVPAPPAGSRKCRSATRSRRWTSWCARGSCARSVARTSTRRNCARRRMRWRTVPPGSSASRTS